MRDTAAAFEIVASCMLDQNATHHLRRDRKEMRPVLPLHAGVVHKPHIGLVDQGRRLQAVAGTLSLHVAARQPVERIVDDWG